MQKEGILTLKTPEFEIILSPQFLSHPVKENHNESDLIKDKQPSEEELLFWSSPGVSP